MDHNFTLKLQEWVNTPDEQKNWDEGAILLLQLSGNKIMYANISHNPKGKAEFIKGKLQKYLDFRLQQLTHEQVTQMQQQVDEIVAKHPIIAIPVGQAKSEKEPAIGSAAEFKAGKRGDHDLLPDEIKALYVENLDIVNRMRELHLRLRLLSTENATCPDSERYPFLKELIALDKRLHENWDTYDHYVNTPTVGDGSPIDTDADKDADTTDAKADVSPETPAEASPESQSENTEASDGATGTQPEPVVQTETVAEAPKSTAKRTAKRTSKKSTKAE